MSGGLAVIVAGDVAREARESGAHQRLTTLKRIVSEVCDEVLVLGPREWKGVPDHVDLLVGQSWSTTLSLRRLQGRSEMTWFDACDSTVALRTSARGNRPIKSLVALTRDVALTRSFTPDVVTYITASDAVNDARLWNQPPLVLPIRWPKYSPLPLRGSRRIVLTGDGHYPPNRDAAVWASTILRPALRTLGVQIPLWVYGAGYDLGVQDGVHFAGYEPDSNALYQEGDIHIAPVTSGAGMNSKVAIPLLAGLDVVTTPMGIEGLNPSSRTTVCDLTDFAPVIARLSLQPAVSPLDLSLAQVLQRDDTDVILARLCMSDDSTGGF